MRFLFLLVTALLMVTALLTTQDRQLRSSELSIVLPVGENRYRVSSEERIANITPEEAERRAIIAARKRAIEYHSGIEISGMQTNIEAELNQSTIVEFFSNISLIMTEGFVVAEDIIDIENLVRNNVLYKRVVMEIEVESQEGIRDYSFSIQANLNKPVFIEGDKMIISVKSSEEAYVTVISIYSNETASLIFPNRYQADNYLHAQRWFKIPSEEDNYSIPVYLLPEKESDVEQLLIIATKKPFTFHSFERLSVYNTLESSFLEVMKQLVTIPRDQIETTFLVYTVFKN